VIGAVLILMGLLWVGRGQLRRPGVTFLLMVIGYGAIRFLLTNFRQETIVAFGLQEAQVVAVVTSAIALVLLAVRLAQRKRTAVQSA